ncbi:MAG: HAD-IC family P-type ATPase [Dehalococcoidales bacterium]|nr:HAD-IC family P-type ATPase [Dehalococcoidales bacterium]
MKENESVSWHTLAVDEVILRLETMADGLSEEEAAARLRSYGPNVIKTGKETSIWKILLHQVASPLIYVLLAAMVVTLVIQHWADAIVIGFVVGFNTIVGFIQEYRAENAMQALMKLSAPKATVRRKGGQKEIESAGVVPGDVVLISAGDAVPADVRLIESSRLQIDESLLTGESVPSQKSPRPMEEENLSLADRVNMAFMGTAVTSGSGAGVVIATGQKTQMGTIAESILGTERAESPLQHRIVRFARWISLAIVAISAVAFGLGLALGEPLVDMFLTAISLAVSAMPEGLPVVVTIALAVSVQRMAKRHAILRRLPAVETLGSCTAILSDKTGTLTMNRMTVREIWAGGNRFRLEEDGLFREDGRGSGAVEVEMDTPLYQVLLAGVLANEASLKSTDGEVVGRGDPTEVALLVSGKRAGLDRDTLLKEYYLVDQIPFESGQRYSASIHSGGETKVVFVKGAPERVVSMCDSAAVRGGRDEIDKQVILEEARRMAEQGLRVLAMAVGEGKSVTASVETGKPGGLTFLGLQGMLDPPREDAAKAVKACHQAGIKVVMVTGDNPATAASIAQKVGILTGKAETITGPELEELPDEKLDKIVANISVYARVNPSQKLRLVNTLRKLGEIVAVTGDGVNDAPALKSAHIGVAMGSGTDVAKEASEMVITDDSFATIYSAVEEGRTVFANISKATFFLISSGIGEVIAILTSLAMRLPLPLLPAQILWLNLVTNGVEDVALAFEPGEKEIFRAPPRDPKAGILSRLLVERSLLVGLVMAAGTLGVFVWERNLGATLEYARAAALTTLVAFQIFHVFNCRSVERSIFRKSLFSNRFLLVGTALSLMAHIGALYWGPTQNLLKVEPLSPDTWLRLVSIAISILPVVELHKLFRHPFKNVIDL